jgi:hypothetical protein
LGLFDNIVGALRETNEAAHGARLKSDTFATLDLLHRAGPKVETQGLQQYLKLFDHVMANCQSWSRDGRLRVAAQFQAEARKNKDFDIGKAYGYYLASAFLECMARESPDAKLTFVHLGVVAEEVRKQLSEQTRKVSSSRDAPDILPIVDTCMACILGAAFWPATDEKTTGDFCSRIAELTEDGQIIIVSVAFGLLDGVARLAKLEQAETLACMAVFLSSHMGYPEDVIPPILKDLMAHSGMPITKKYTYISMGGEAAFAFLNKMEDVRPLVECGFEIRKLLDAIVLW